MMRTTEMEENEPPRYSKLYKYINSKSISHGRWMKGKIKSKYLNAEGGEHTEELSHERSFDTLN